MSTLLFLLLFLSSALCDFPYLCYMETKCFRTPEDIGCFPQGPFTQFCHQVFAPNSPEENGIEIEFYTPNGQSFAIDFWNLTASVSSLTFDQSKPFWALVHGFGGRIRHKDWMLHVKDTIIQMDQNVLLLYWLKGSKGPDYPQAVANTRVVGAVLARVIQELTTQHNLRVENTNVVGFSLGAHVAGFAGQRLPGLRRIIGLDPAGPLYENEHPISRLDPSDARFVQCIHTNGDSVFEGGGGTLQQMGHIDFYSNGGKIQPGCHKGASLETVSDIWHLNFTVIFEDVTCSHFRAHKLFHTSLFSALEGPNACKLEAYPCDSTAAWESGRCFPNSEQRLFPIAGVETDLGSKFRGKYYFSTRAYNDTSSHFCGTQFAVTLTSDQTTEGAFTLKFKGAKQQSNDVDYFYEAVKLEKAEPATRFVAVPWGLTDPVQVDIFYERSDPWHAEKFTLLNATLTRADGTKFLSTGPVQIIDNVHSYVTFA